MGRTVAAETPAAPRATGARLRAVAHRTFESLADRDFRLYWIGALSAQTGVWIQIVGQAWLVLSLTDSPLALGSIASLQFAPVLLFTIFGGVVADRLPRRRTLMALHACAAAGALLLAALSALGAIAIWQVYVLALVSGLLQAFDAPVRSSFFTELVDRERLPNAVALNSSTYTLSRLVGPAIGGVAIVVVGYAGCFALNAAACAPAIVTLALIRARPAPAAAAPRAAMLASIRAGLTAARATPRILLPLLIMGALGMFGFQYPVVLPLVARYHLAVGPEGLGLATSAIGVGSILATGWMAYRRGASAALLLAAAWVFAAGWAAVGLTRWFPLALVAFAVIGFAGSVFLQGAQGAIQLAAPPELRGRVMSLWFTLLTGTTPVGTLVLGAVAERFDVAAMLVLVAACCALGTGVATVYAARSALIVPPRLGPPRGAAVG